MPLSSIHFAMSLVIFSVIISAMIKEKNAS